MHHGDIFVELTALLPPPEQGVLSRRVCERMVTNQKTLLGAQNVLKYRNRGLTLLRYTVFVWLCVVDKNIWAVLKCRKFYRYIKMFICHGGVYNT